MKLYLATGNVHKIREFTAMLPGSGIDAEVLSPATVGGMPDVEEDAPDFSGNARKKAAALAGQIHRRGDVAGPWAAVADDSGLCVDALGGGPGVHSARYAGAGAEDGANLRKLLAALAEVPASQKSAAFHCAIAAVFNDGRETAAEGRCPGTIIPVPRGAGGFGYDPVFVPEGESLTFAELPAETKNRISHRARALAAFVSALAGTCQVEQTEVDRMRSDT